jgi:hypothetical protein
MMMSLRQRQNDFDSKWQLAQYTDSLPARSIMELIAISKQLISLASNHKDIIF